MAPIGPLEKRLVFSIKSFTIILMIHLQSGRDNVVKILYIGFI